MEISNVMTRDVKIASPEDTLQHAAKVMESHDFGLLPVGENDRLVGMLSDRDIVIRAAAEGRDLRTTKVREAMTADVAVCSEDDDVIRSGNDTSFGLASGIWTRDINKAHRTAHRLRAGTVWINCYSVFDAAMPFGGYKESGWGREMGHNALDNYLETKSILRTLDLHTVCESANCPNISVPTAVTRAPWLNSSGAIARKLDVPAVRSCRLATNMIRVIVKLAPRMP